MKCPCCGKSLSLPNNTLSNMESYVHPVMSVTLCCGQLVSCYPRVTFTAHKYEGSDEVDHWGRAPKKA